MRVWALLLVLLVPVLVFVAVSLQGSGGVDPATVPTHVAARGPFQITLTVTGELEAVNSVVVTAPTAGGSKKVTKLTPEGDRVEKGEVIVTFDDTDFRKELKESQNALLVVETKIEQHHSSAERDLAELDNQIAKARLDIERAQLTLTDSDTVARIERERARISVEEAGLTLTRLERNRELKVSDLASQLRLLELEEENVLARVVRSQEALESCTVTAPTSGLVILSKVWKGSGWGTVEEGDTVWPGQTVLEVPDLNALQVVAQVHEVDAGQVAVGQRAALALDAFPGPSFEGTLKTLANLATATDRGSKIKYFRTVFTVDTPSEQMKPGMTTKVDIEIKTLEDALAVPREAVFEGPAGQRVFVQEGRSFVSRDVVTGSSNSTHTVIEEGLKAGETLALINVEEREEGGAAPAAPGDGPVAAAKE